MGKFLNTNHTNTINSLVEGFKKKLDNPYYLYTDKKAVLVTYYNQNLAKSSLDEGSQLNYEPIGKDSPTRYNKILDAYLFGIERIMADLDMGEYGLESSPIEGECIVIPNTFEPLPNDYFTINHHKSDNKLLFKVTSVNIDTADNGANFYKLNYRLSTIDDDNYSLIENQVVDTFNMVINNVGSQYKAIVKNTEYNAIEELEIVLDRLKEYYVALFFKNRIQTFVYKFDDRNFYDPFMIEFLRRHDVLKGLSKDMYVSHAIPTSPTFYLDYDRTFFRSLELANPKKINPQVGYAIAIYDKLSLMFHRPEDYYSVQYFNNLGPGAYPLETLEPQIFECIRTNSEFTPGNPKAYNNIIIRHFNDEARDIKEDTIGLLESMEFIPDIKMFYAIPFIIYVLEHKIDSILKKE